MLSWALTRCYFIPCLSLCARSNLLLCGPPELALAKLAFGGAVTSTGCMDLGKRVSRKKEFVPPLTGCIASYEAPVCPSRSAGDLAAMAAEGLGESELFVDPKDPMGKVQRRFSTSPRVAPRPSGPLSPGFPGM